MHFIVWTACTVTAITTITIVIITVCLVLAGRRYIHHYMAVEMILSPIPEAPDTIETIQIVCIGGSTYLDFDCSKPIKSG
jgi:hypothetical protein